jgi:hypothetical protein
MGTLNESEQIAVDYLVRAIAAEDAKIAEAAAKKTVLEKARWDIESILERGHDDQ